MSTKTIDQRLDSIEIMLATILNRLAATPDDTSDMKQFIAQWKAQGVPMVEIVKKWNNKGKS